MKPNETYFARTTFSTIDTYNNQVTFQAGHLMKAASFDEVIDNSTGVVTKLPRHVARNPDWYFHQVGQLGVNATGPKVSQADYAVEQVRGNQGLDFDCYWKLGELELWLPCQTQPATRNVYSACLSSHPRIKVQLNGVLVTGTKKVRGSLKGYTYHV